ncbi:MAG: DUF2281 domain-containing protein [Spirochaetota bacterium]|jgi:hypothetical protein|nr:DUF2281 domain-containing protein [Spirochaetota bacterium]
MTNRALLLQEVETLPANCVDEVVDFVQWIKHRRRTQIPETMLMSEAARAKDWDTQDPRLLAASLPQPGTVPCLARFAPCTSENEAWANL